VLAVAQLNQFYGGSHILRDVSFEVPAGKVTALLGRNGVGKTTLLRTLMGVIPAKTGTVRFGDADLSAAKPYERVRAGIGYVPQGREIFPRLTVEENLRMGLATRPLGADVPARIYEMFPVLRQMLRRRGGDLSGGQQQQLAIGRALMAKPSLLLLDEPSDGIQPSLVAELTTVMKAITAERGMALVLVEQNIEMALSLCSRAVFIDHGHALAGETSETLRRDPALIEAHLAI